MKKGDLLLALTVAFAALVLAWALRPGGAGTWAVVRVDGQETARYPLDQPLQVKLGGADYNILCIGEGAAWIEEANCGDHTCVNTGAISREGESIVCLPHRLIVQVEGGERTSWDALAG